MVVSSETTIYCHSFPPHLVRVYKWVVALCCFALLAPAAPAKNTGNAHPAPHKSNAPQPKAKSPQELMQMLDDVESGRVASSARTGTAGSSQHRSGRGYAGRSGMFGQRSIAGSRGGMPLGGGMGHPAMQSMQAGGNRQSMLLQALQKRMQGMRQGSGGQPAMMQMLQQRMQGANGGAGASPLMQMLKQRMQAQGGQSGMNGAAPLGQNLLQRMHGMQEMQGMNRGMSAAPAPLNQTSMTPLGAAASTQRGSLLAHPQHGSFGAVKTPQSGAAGSGSNASDLEKQMEDQYGH